MVGSLYENSFLQFYQNSKKHFLRKVVRNSITQRDMLCEAGAEVPAVAGPGSSCPTAGRQPAGNHCSGLLQRRRTPWPPSSSPPA